MKKFAAKAVVLAIGAACGGSVFAGSFTTPATDAAATTYAAEALTGATAVKIATAVYTMGVGRAGGQNFTVILNPANATLATASCTAANLTSSEANASISLKRAAGTECAWDVTVGAGGFATNNSTLTFSNLTLATHSLNVAASTASFTISLKDPGETSFIDNVSTKSRVVAQSVQSVNVYAATSDTATTADVAAPGGPLTGFLPGGVPADTVNVAAANLTFVNNQNSAVTSDGVTAFNFANTTGTVTITLTGTTSGVATNKFCLDLNGDSNYCQTGETMNVTPTAATITFAASNFPAVGSNVAKAVSFQADGNTNLGTARTFALTGTITPTVGAAEALADTAGKNATAWVWTANASQLMTAYFNTNTAKFLTRFFLLNTGTTAVNYNATCYSETGNAITYGAGRNGSLSANGLTTIDATSVCTFAGNTRGSVIFTINAPVSQVKGTYQFVDPVALNGGVLPMVRPYNAANPTE